MNQPNPRTLGTGRPTKEQAEQRHALLLDRALEMFLEQGFELTTIEQIAASINMTKRTIYARYEDKRALFRAAFERAVEQWRIPIETLRAAETGDLEETLLEIAQVRAINHIGEASMKLSRIIHSESTRFPEIITTYVSAVYPTIQYLADLFRRHEPELGVIDDPEFAAMILLSAINTPSRRIVLGGRHDDARFKRQVAQAVRLFLNGLRPRQARPGSGP